MNVRHMVETGEQLIREGRKKEGLELLQTAYDYIRRMNPSGRKDLFALCCHISTIKDGKVILVHCGKDDEHSLFPGTPQEREKLCFECQRWCLQRIKELKKAQKSPEN